AVRKLVGACLKIMDVDRRTIDEGSSNNDAASDRPVRFHRNRAMMRSEMQRFAVTQKNSRIVRLAESRCRLSKRIEHDLQIERRPADDLKHIGGRGLLLQRFAEFIEQARILDGNKRLGGGSRSPFRPLFSEPADFPQG